MRKREIYIGSLMLFGVLGKAVLAADFCLGEGPVTARLIVFSGQPAPTATVSDPGELKLLEARLKELPSTELPTTPPSHLDFGGITITSPVAICGSEETGVIHILNGMIKFRREDGSGPIYQDVHGLESWLLGLYWRDHTGGDFRVPQEWRTSD